MHSLTRQMEPVNRLADQTCLEPVVRKPRKRRKARDSRRSIADVTVHVRREILTVTRSMPAESAKKIANLYGQQFDVEVRHRRKRPMREYRRIEEYPEAPIFRPIDDEPVEFTCIAIDLEINEMYQLPVLASRSEMQAFIGGWDVVKEQVLLTWWPIDAPLPEGVQAANFDREQSDDR